MFYDDEERIFLYVVSSDTNTTTFRHKYEMYPNVLLEKMETGGKLETYDSETGEFEGDSSLKIEGTIWRSNETKLIDFIDILGGFIREY